MVTQKWTAKFYIYILIESKITSDLVTIFFVIYECFYLDQESG